MKTPGFNKQKVRALITMIIILTSLRIGSELNKKFLDLQKKVNLRGFRVGKVPLEIVKKRGTKNLQKWRPELYQIDPRGCQEGVRKPKSRKRR